MVDGRRRFKPVKSIEKSAWPPAFELLFDNAMAENAIQAVMGPSPDAAVLKEGTKHDCTYVMGRYLHAIMPTGCRVADPLDVTNLAAPERLDRFVAALRSDGLAPSTMATYLDKLKMVLKRLAPNLDTNYFDWLVSTIRWEIVRERSTPISTKAIFQIGVEAMEQAKIDICHWERHHRSRGVPGLPFLDYRNGLLIATLALIPLRIDNMLMLSIGSTFREIDGNVGGYRIDILGISTKNGSHIPPDVPRQLNAFIALWLNFYRLELMPTSRELSFWLTIKGAPLGYQGARDAIMSTVQKACGQPLRPHQVRHAAANAITLQGKSKKVIATLLQHESPETASRHYASVEGPRETGVLAGSAGL